MRLKDFLIVVAVPMLVFGLFGATMTIVHLANGASLGTAADTGLGWGILGAVGFLVMALFHYFLSVVVEIIDKRLIQL